MENEYSQSFNVPLLLKFGDLDVRGIATVNDSLSADEYFHAAERFVKEAPALWDALTSVDDLISAIDNLRALNKMLTAIGCYSLAAEIEHVRNEIIHKEWAATEKYAADVLARLNALHGRIKSAYKPDAGKKVRKAENDAEVGETGDAGEQGPEKHDTQPDVSLKELLQSLDKHEANRKLRILAIDDNAFMLKTISFILNNDYDVFTLTKGTAIEKFLRHTTPELFLLDYNMPEVNGFELVPIIRSFEEHKDTPIIFLTAMGTSEHVATAASLGICDYAVKPVKPDILREKIAKHIVKKKTF